MKKFTVVGLGMWSLVSTLFASSPTYRTTFSITPYPEQEDTYRAEVQIEKINPDTASYELILSPTLVVVKNEPANLTTPTQDDEISLDIVVSDDEKVTISIVGRPLHSSE